jgi:hypothetical protein
MILTNTCLSSLPTYAMGFYLLPVGTQRNGQCEVQILLEGSKWELQYAGQRNFGISMQAKGTWGLGIVNTQIFNECLMVKWIWKLYNQKDSLWARH